MEIKKVILDRKEKTLTVDFTKIEKDREKIVDTQSSSRVVHPDFLKAFAGLRVHFALMTGYIEPTKTKDISKIKEEELEPFNISRYSITGAKGDGVMISGFKKLSDGKVNNMNTPFYLVEEKEESRYKFMDELLKTIGAIEKEVLAYLDGSKVGVKEQGELEFDEQEQ